MEDHALTADSFAVSCIGLGCVGSIFLDFRWDGLGWVTLVGSGHWKWTHVQLWRRVKRRHLLQTAWVSSASSKPSLLRSTEFHQLQLQLLNRPHMQHATHSWMRLNPSTHCSTSDVLLNPMHSGQLNSTELNWIVQFSWVELSSVFRCALGTNQELWVGAQSRRRS